MTGRYKWFGIFGTLVLGSSMSLLAQSALPSSSSKGKAAQQDAKQAQVIEQGIQVDSSYRIGVEDDLMISVWHEPELSSPVTVRPDGIITLPLLNDLHVIGLTTKELQDLVTEKLKPFVTEPQVTIIVRAIKSRKVYLLGQVSRPGTYPLNANKTVLQLLAEAGGPGPFAKSKSIYVLREENGKRVKMNFNYKRAMSGGAAQDILLQSGDMIVVP